MRRKIITLLLAVCFALSLLPVGALADTTVGGNFGTNLTWKIKDGVLTISGTGEMPDNGGPWFDYRDSFTKLVIKDGVTRIGDHSFECCANILSLTIGNGVKSIGEWAFDSCFQITSLTIPDSVTRIGAAAFDRCSDLENVKIGNGVKIIEGSAFERCGAIKSVTIGTGITRIDDYAFAHSAVSDVYYAGTKNQWNAVSVGSDGNEGFLEATFHYGAAAPAAPALKITTSAGHPKIYWNAVKGATKYWIYRSTDGKNFKYYDTTKNKSYTNNSTSIGTTYYYKVKAVKTVGGKDFISSYSVAKSIKCKPAVPSLSISRSNGKPKLSWKAVSGAAKYWVYRSTDGKNFKYYDTTNKTSYTNSSAASGTKYYYRVKAVAVVNGKNITSANSSTKSLMTTLAKPSVSITTSNGKPKLSWKAVTGADKYYIYRSTDGENFGYFDSTTRTSYTNTGAKKDTKYYYKVKAVCASNSYANSAYSTAVGIKATK